MADDNRIEIIASLDIPKSISTIKEDLEKVSKGLGNDSLKIVAGLDLSKTSQAIKSQLDTISKNIRLNLGGLNINSSTINTQVSDVVSNIQNVLGSAANIKLQVDSKPIDEFVNRLQDVGVGDKIIDKLKDKLESLNVVITKIVPQFTRLKGGKQTLTSFSITGLDKAGNTVEYIEKFNAETGDFEKSSTKMISNLVKIQQENKKVEDSAKAAQIAYNDFLKLQGTADIYSKKYGDNERLQSQLDGIRQIMSEFDNTQPVEKQRETIIKLDNALKSIKVDIDAINQAKKAVVSSSFNDYYPNIAKIASTDKSSKTEQLDVAKTTLNDFFKAENIEDSANRIKRAVEDTSGELQRFYVQVEKGDKSVETLTYALNEQGTAYEYLGKTIREADNSTDFRRKDLSTQWQIQSENLIKFANNADKAGLASTVLKEDIQSLFEELNKANPASGGTTSSMNAFLDNFDIAKAKLQAFRAEMSKENASLAFGNRVRKLTADVNAYAESNKKAVNSTKQMANGNTFAAEWASIMSRMAKGTDLSDRELKELVTDLAVFKKEAKSAGLTGASAFEKFANSFKLISTYISANQLVNKVISQIREAITELKTIDEVLTEISKTSDRTEASLRKLGDTSFDTASKYGRVASDYLLGVQEMSRAGFGEQQSENLAELSVLAQVAGDMTAEMANEYIIATNAAYGLEGSEEKLNQVLDSQNYITNHNALNMENLAQATKVAASQASASGIAIDELTAAVGTMVAVTQQGGDTAGRAFKGILMNLQQVKGSAAEIGDGGEDITTESLTKYEAATKALGVSLKEVRNGVVQLRDPMEILKELSIAVGNEAEGSIKVANLISAVGGKFRGNQLIALLKNWETYEKILSEFNSDKAVGSAMQEAEKSANNWSGSLNKLKNSWAEFANQIINSDEAIKLIQSINTIIQSLTESAATGTLKTIGQGLNSIVQILAKIIDKFDVLSPLITSIFVGKLGKAALNGKTIFGTVADEAEGAIPQITLFGKKMSDIKKSAGSIDGNPILNLGKAFTSAEIKAFALEVAVSALNAAITFGLSLAITEGIKFISKWINKSKEAAEAAEQLRKEQEERRQEAVNNISTYEQEADALSDLAGQYVKLVSSTEDINSVKDSLLSIQDQIIEKYNLEADAIDLVNGKMSDNLELIQQVQKEEAQKWLRDNRQAIEEAEDYFEKYNQSGTWRVGTASGLMYATSTLEDDINIYQEIKRALREKGQLQDFIEDEWAGVDAKGNVASYDKILGLDTSMPLDEQIKHINELIDAYDDVYNKIKKGETEYNAEAVSQMKMERDALASLVEQLSNTNKILDTRDEFESVIQSYKEITPVAQDTFNDLATQMQSLGQKMNAPGATDSMIYQYTLDLADLKSQMEALVAENPALSESMELLFKNVELGVSGIAASASDLRGAWLETFDSMHKDALSDVEKIEKAMQTLAEGDYLDFDTFKELVWDMDADGVIQNIKQIDDQYKLSTEELIRLKDALIQKQKEQIALDTESAQKNIEQNKKQIAALQAEIDRQIASGIRSTGDEAIINALRTKMNELTDANAAFGDEIKRNNQLIQEYNRHLGNTTDISKVLEASISKLKDEISDLSDKADKMLKAQEKQIDNIVDGLEDEKEALESQKQELENQLSILEAQKDELDEIIENYKDLANIVGDTIDKEIEAIEKERQAVEDYYDDLISKLQKQNEERETALDLAEKMANLENARNNKVRTYDETRGWVYETDLEAVRKAENELESAKVEQQISELEKQKETALLEGGYDERIEQLEDYKGEYQSIIDEIQEAEDEQLAAELLGADWREKIRAMDKETLEKFRTNFRSYNSQLSSLVNGEIKTLKDSISAKEKEIKAKDEQITAWNKYKQAVTEAAQSVKDSLEGYDQYLGTLTLDENSSYADRITNLQNFVSQYTALMDEIANKNSVLEYQQGLLNDIGGSASSGSGRIEGLAEGIKNSVVEMFEKISDLFKQIIKRVAQGSGESLKAIFNDVFGSFSGGGVADQTGLAMLHGTKTQSETIFNATQSKKLYDYVNQTPNLIADVMDRASKLNGISLNSSGNSTSTKTITFEKPTIVLEGVNNPNEFMRQMDNYLQVTLTESQVKK